MPERLGRYELRKEIASGGQATVYEAFDTVLGRVVALKVLHPHLASDPQYIERFVREARSAASLSHPNVITIFEVGQEGGRHFIAMEYLPRSLDAELCEKGPLSVERASEMLRQVALGLHAAHEHGVVHRDLKPQNILITEDGIPKVTDFGIARAADFSTMTASGIVMGTPQYMSPEQARGDRVDRRSDLYSLGIVLYQCMTNHTPLEGQTPQQVLTYHLKRQRISPGPLRSAVLSADVVAIFERLTAYDPKSRYENAEQVADDLAQVKEGLSRGKQGATTAPSFARGFDRFLEWREIRFRWRLSWAPPGRADAWLRRLRLQAYTTQTSTTRQLLLRALFAVILGAVTFVVLKALPEVAQIPPALWAWVIAAVAVFLPRVGRWLFLALLIVATALESLALAGMVAVGALATLLFIRENPRHIVPVRFGLVLGAILAPFAAIPAAIPLAIAVVLFGAFGWWEALMQSLAIVGLSTTTGFGVGWAHFPALSHVLAAKDAPNLQGDWWNHLGVLWSGIFLPWGRELSRHPLPYLKLMALWVFAAFVAGRILSLARRHWLRAIAGAVAPLIVLIGVPAANNVAVDGSIIGTAIGGALLAAVGAWAFAIVFFGKTWWATEESYRATASVMHAVRVTLVLLIPIAIIGALVAAVVVQSGQSNGMPPQSAQLESANTGSHTGVAYNTPVSNRNAAGAGRSKGSGAAYVPPTNTPTATPPPTAPTLTQRMSASATRTLTAPVSPTATRTRTPTPVAVVVTAAATPIPTKAGTRPVPVPAPQTASGEAVIVTSAPLMGEVGLEADQPLDSLKNWGVGETLFLNTGPSGTPQPWLAASWSVSNDLKHGTIKVTNQPEFAALVNGHYKSFGNMTADDVAWSMNTANAATNPTSIHDQAGDFAGLWGKWTAVDDQTIRFDFNHYDPTWTTNFTNIAGQAFVVFSHKADQQMGDSWAKDHTVATGPYLIKQWSDGNFVQLVSRDSLGHQSWKLHPKTASIKIQEVAEPTSAAAMLKTGEADATQLDIKDVAPFVAGGFQTVGNGNATQLGVFFAGNLWQTTTADGKPIDFGGVYVHNLAWIGNPSDPKDLKTAQSVRFAMAEAYDRQAIANAITGGLAWPVQVEYVSPKDPHWQDKWNYGYHPHNSAQILCGKDPNHPMPETTYVKDNVTADQQKELCGNAFSISLYAGPELGGGAEISGRVNDAVAGYWQDLGLTVFSLKYDYATFRPTIVARSDTMPWLTACDLGNTAIPWSDPKSAVETVLTRGGFGCGYESPVIYNLYEQETHTPDAAKRTQLVNQYVQYKYEQALSPGVIAVPNLEVINPKKIKSWDMEKTQEAFPTDYWNIELQSRA